MKKILVISQAMPQWQADVLENAAGKSNKVYFLTGTDIKQKHIKIPEHDPQNIKSRLYCWIKHYRYMMKWLYKHRNAKYDLIFANSNPPINSFIGLKAKKILKAPFVYMNWDLYPQFIEAKIHNPAVKAICYAWHEWNAKNYPKIDKIMTIGDRMAEKINDDISGRVDVKVIPTGVDTDYVRPIKKQANAFIKENGLEGKFIVLYSGKMGIGHNIELILECARELDGKEPVIHFVFIGEGEKYVLVENFIKDYKLSNVSLLPLQPYHIFPITNGCGDIGIVTQENQASELFMPGKTYSIMASGEAVIGIGSNKGDLYEIVTRGNVGIMVTSGKVKELKDAILDLYTNREKLEVMKENARKLAVEKYDNKVIVEGYKEVFSHFI